MGAPFHGTAGEWPPVPRLYDGETVVIAASGPSLDQDQVDRVRGQRLIVINTTSELAPWADMLYACDAKWWDAHEGAPGFRGLKVTQDEQAAQKWGLKRVPLVYGAGLSLEPERIHGGGNGGYQALNLAVLLGARRIILLGYDMQHSGSRIHWHGRHPDGMNNPRESTIRAWTENFRSTVPDLERAGVEVINASRETALDCFPRASLDSAL